MSEVKVLIGPQVILSYKRLSYKMHYALAEMVDNSVSSFLINREQLEKVADSAMDKPLSVRIVYDKDNEIIRVSDNAMGMDLTEVMGAMSIADPPEANVGRHEFGMGLKTSACWLGDFWEVTTTKLGSDEEYRVSFDVNKIAEGNTELPIRTSQVDPDSHYTVIEISQLHHRPVGRAKGATLPYLRSLFRLDTAAYLSLWWGEDELDYAEDLSVLKAADGSPHRRNFRYAIGGKDVWGWVGVLEKGGRSKAGLAQIRKGRVVQGQPGAWKPQGIYGESMEGANNLVSQRLVGEVHFDDSFIISHTKDQIIFEGDDEAVLIDYLRDEFTDYITTARDRRKKGEGGGPPKVAEDAALNLASELVSSTEFVDRVVADPIPTTTMVDLSKNHVLKQTEDVEPHRVWNLDNLQIKVYLSNDLSPQDPYYVADFPGNNIICCIVNKEHPFWTQNLFDTQDILVYLLMATYDSIAEYKLRSRASEIQPDTVRSIKDGFMRIEPQ